jgi:hypothetical protein
MKQQLKIIIALFCTALILITGLTSWRKKPANKAKARNEFHIPIANDDLRKRMEQRAIVTALVMRDNNILQLYVNAVKAKLAANDQNDESITFDEISQGSKSYVIAFASAFKAAYKSVLNTGGYFRSSSFANLPAGDFSGRIDVSNIPQGDEVFYKNDGAQIYFPYSENFYNSDVTGVFVTYHPLEEVESNESFKLLSDNVSDVQTFTVDENYAETHPVLVINFNEEENPIVESPQDPPPPPYICNFLDYNTFADVLDDRYVISASMPKVKLLKNFRTFIGGTNRITIRQFYAKPHNLGPNPTPTLDPITANDRVVVHNYIIRRKQKGKWVSFGLIYNDDWRLIQYDNPMYLWSKTGWFSNPTGSVDVKVQGGLRVDTVHVRDTTPVGWHIEYKWVKSFNAGASAAIHLDIEPKYRLEGSDYVTRRGLLANCVGDNFGNGTALDAGETVPYTVRKISDAMLYYFKVRECHQ